MAQQQHLSKPHSPRTRDNLHTGTLRKRTLQLQMLADANLSPKPRPKIAIQQNRPLAVLRAFIHLPALLGNITLVLLNCVTCFFAPATSNAPISVLRFTAKVHELLMQMSIAALALSYICDQAWELRVLLR
jgi:hypothetical protein